MQMKRLLFVAGAMLATVAAAQDNPFGDRVRQAMAAEERPAGDVERDANRRPVETLAFFGITEDMQVLELIPGGGWYTRLLAPALRDTGKLYVAIGTGRVADGLLQEPGYDQVAVLAPEISTERTEQRLTDITEPFSFGVSGLDAALTFRNMHNFTERGRRMINQAVFESLKPGGIYGVVDHTRRHMQPDDPENRRRADPVQIIQEALDAGFELVGYSDLHYRPDDELRYEVGRRTVTGNTDRFTLLFRRPE